MVICTVALLDSQQLNNNFRLVLSSERKLQHNTMQSGTLRAHAVRIEPEEDLVPALLRAAQQALANHHDSNGISSSQSCFVLTAVGSTSEITLRMANAVSGKEEPIKTWNECMEILSLVGTISGDGKKHLHMCLSDARGRTVGGHLVAGRVHTTLELVLGTIDGVAFGRRHDDRTAFRELVVEKCCAQQGNSSHSEQHS